jgi:hypothetical protein
MGLMVALAAHLAHAGLPLGHDNPSEDESVFITGAREVAWGVMLGVLNAAFWNFWAWRFNGFRLPPLQLVLVSSARATESALGSVSQLGPQQRTARWAKMTGLSWRPWPAVISAWRPPWR